jgi:hypothetical protein
MSQEVKEEERIRGRKKERRKKGRRKETGTCK